MLKKSNKSKKSGKSTKAPATVTLGTTRDVEAFWTFPNNTSGVGIFGDQTIANTVTLYVEASINRDGVDVTVTDVYEEGGSYYLGLDGSDAPSYKTELDLFITAGMEALRASRLIHDPGQRWDPVWRFMLPLGLALKNNQCVELLHFPPEYVLERDRDYLLANTLIRWGECLILQGVSPAEVDRYQTTIDIAPIGADSGAGNDIGTALGDYSEYTTYLNQLIRNWTSTDGIIKPLVTFGYQARTWLRNTFFPGNPDFSVLNVGTIDIDGQKIPFAIANHPSYFYNSIEDESPVPPTNYDELASIMYEDLVVARWQYQMSRNPLQPPSVVMLQARAYYDSVEGQLEVCAQVYLQGFDLEPDQSAGYCNVPAYWHKSKNQIFARLKEKAAKLGALEGRDTPALVRFAERVKAKRHMSKPFLNK